MLTNIRLRSYNPEVKDDCAFVEGDEVKAPCLSSETTTFGRAYLDYIWQSIEREGLDRAVFYDGAIRSAEDLARLLAPGRAWAYCFERDGEILGLWWCNGHTGHMAQIHFCIFKAGRPYGKAMGRAAVRFIMKVPKRPSGEPRGEPSGETDGTGGQSSMDYLTAPVSVLCGVTPAPYRHAIQYGVDLGFQVVAQLPRATYLAPRALGGRGQGRYVDAVLTVLKREDCV